MRKRLLRMERRTINPNSRFIFYWDQIIVVALLCKRCAQPLETHLVTMRIFMSDCNADPPSIATLRRHGFRDAV